MIQILSVAIALAAAALSYLQVLRMRRDAHGDLLLSVGNDLNSRETREQRRVVYSLANKPLVDWTLEERFTAEQVAASLGNIGLLARHGYIDGKGYDYWGHSVVLCYQIVEPLIDQRRRAENIPSHFVYFEWLARKAYQHLNSDPWWAQESLERLRQETRDISSYYDVSRLGVGGPVKPHMLGAWNLKRLGRWLRT